MSLQDVVEFLNSMASNYERESELCYNGLVHDATHQTDTCILGVKNFFEKHGFLVEDTGTGAWNVYISARMKKLVIG